MKDRFRKRLLGHRTFEGVVLAMLCASLAACTAESRDNVDEETSQAEQAVGVTPNDPYFPTQNWHYSAIHVPLAWTLTTGSSNVLVAVIDSGKMSHSDLNAKWLGGYDFYSGDSDASDFGTYHHGIHVAGIIGASSNNGVGVAGICWGCQIMPVLAEVSGGITSVSSPGYQDYVNHTHHVLANSIRYAAGLSVSDGAGHTVQSAKRANVINISLGNGRDPCPAELQSAVNDAVNAGTTVVVAAGDGDYDKDYVASHYTWASCQNVITVTAVTENGAAEAYSSLGSGVTISAPGGSAVNGGSGWGALVGCVDPNEQRGSGTHGVFSTWSTSQGTACYRHWAGTSLATPHVTGVVALMLSRSPSLTPAQVTQILKGTAQPISCPTSQCGAGMLDAYAAARAAVLDVAISCDASGGHFGCSTDLGGLGPYSATWNGVSNAAVSAASLHDPTGATGTCPVNTTATVSLTVTDKLGRTTTKARSFSCPKVAL